MYDDWVFVLEYQVEGVASANSALEVLLGDFLSDDPHPRCRDNFRVANDSRCHWASGVHRDESVGKKALLCPCDGIVVGPSEAIPSDHLLPRLLR